MTFVLDIDAEDEYFIPTASARQCQAIERVSLSTHEASTSRAYVEPAFTSHVYIEHASTNRLYTEYAAPSRSPTADDHVVGEVPDVSEDDLKASVPGTPLDPTLLTSYPTHVAAFI